MSKSNDDDWYPISEAVKSISISELEQCIAEAISEKVKGKTAVKCYVTKIDTSSLNGTKLNSELANDFEESPF